MELASDAKTSPLTTSSQRIEVGLKWLQDTYGEDWFMEIDLNKGLDMNSSNLHLITHLSGKDYNLWMLEGFQEFMFEHGFSTGEEIVQDAYTKEYIHTEQQQDLQETWLAIITALQLVRGAGNGVRSDEEASTSSPETGTVLRSGRTVLEDSGRGAEGDPSDKHGVSPSDELRSPSVQRDSSEVRLPDSQDGEHSSEQLSLF